MVINLCKCYNAVILNAVHKKSNFLSVLSLKWYFVPNIVLTYFEKNCYSDQEKLLKLKAEDREFAKKIEITRAIYSNSERSQQFLKCFLNLFLEVSHI